MTRASVAADVGTAVDRALFGFLAERGGALPDGVPLMLEIERVVRSGGKRLRPAFCVWGYRAGGGEDDERIARAAASLELLHTFAIIHDDVMDRSPLRRGIPATYRNLADTDGLRADAGRFGESAAILVGDLAMALADELWSSAGFDGNRLASASRIYHAMRAEVIGGQYLDLLASARRRATPEETRQISVLKSGRYTVERPLQIGAALAGAVVEVHGALSAFGGPLGEAFQLRDDVIGAFGDPSVTGKSADGDLREGKQTTLVAYARKNADDGQRALLDERLGADDFGEDDAQALRAVLRDTGALRQVEELIDSLVADARAALARTSLPEAAVRALDALAAEATVRVA